MLRFIGGVTFAAVVALAGIVVGFSRGGAALALALGLALTLGLTLALALGLTPTLALTLALALALAIGGSDGRVVALPETG